MIVASKSVWIGPHFSEVSLLVKGEKEREIMIGGFGRWNYTTPGSFVSEILFLLAPKDAFFEHGAIDPTR
jgi:hypothetical protein